MWLTVLFLRGKVEERLALVDDLLEQLVRDPYILQVDKADLHERMAEISQELGLGLGVVGQSQIQNRNRREGHLRG